MAPGRNFNSRVRHPRDGDPVNASVAGAGERDLEARTNYLKELYDAIETRRLLAHENQTVDADLLEGHAVFWNADEQRYEAALAGVEIDAASGSFVSTAATDCLGILLVKDTPTTGTIGIAGMAHLTATQLANMIDGTATPGRYYLSPASAGKLVRQRPAVTVAVVYLLGPADACEEGGWVFILPQVRDFLEDHIHYQIELTARPAGTHVPPAIGQDHEITDADDTERGWLPATHASFADTAPTGARFGYNLAAHEELNRLWPPLPVTAAILEMHKPQSSIFPLAGRVLPEYVQMDLNGIWWMTDCYDSVPWPTDLDTTVSLSSSSTTVSSSSSMADVCPTAAMRLILSFLRMVFATDKTVVTSLAPDTDEPIEFVNCDGVAATTGDLKARLKLQALTDPDEFYGGQVLKEIIDTKIKFGRGWVTEGVIASSDRVVLTSTRQRYRTPGDSATPRVHQGLVTLDINLDPSDRELSPEVVKLGDALEREYRHITYLGFPEARDSGLRMQFNVPTAGLPTAPQMKIRVLMFGRADGPWCELTMSHYRITPPTDGVPTELAEGDTALTFDVVTPSDDYDGAGGDLPADNAILIESDEFTVAAGDTVFVQLSRAADAEPAYGAELGLIRVVGVIVAEDA